MSFPYMIQGNNIVVVIDRASHTISNTHVAYTRIREAIKADDWDTVRELIEPKKAVLKFGKGNITIENNTLYWKGEVVHNALTLRMIQMLQEGFTIEPMVQFMENLMANPSRRSVTELYGFLEKNSLPITPDGHFLAYKKVRDNFFDIHSGTMDNSPGKVLEMERNAVDDDKDRTCSTGLHFCSIEYLPHFGRTSGDRVVILKINPKDVVSIPSDYNDAKGRACRYEVISELVTEPEKAFTKAVQKNAHGSVAPAKKGCGPFSMGYTEGYTGKPVRGVRIPTTGKERVAYDDGYAAGEADLEAGISARYVYEPKAVPQEFDAKGRPLSMTPGAIKKRAQRKLEKARAKVAVVTPAQAKLVKAAALWPAPKKK